MATYLLLHGAGGDSWHWHLVAPLLRQRGHDVVAPDLPTGDASANLDAYVDAAVGALGDRGDVTVVAQSLSGFVAPVVAARRPVAALVLVNAMIPLPGETAGEWWSATGHVFPDPFDEVEIFLHDVPRDVRAAAAAHAHPQADRVFADPLPLDAWPDVPTRAVVCREDRFFTAEFQTRVLRDRLGLEPELLDSGHCPALSRPEALVELLA
jgi:pimeloyl-ACP methyl ester carboxylesterase